MSGVDFMDLNPLVATMDLTGFYRDNSFNPCLIVQERIYIFSALLFIT